MTRGPGSKRALAGTIRGVTSRALHSLALAIVVLGLVAPGALAQAVATRTIDRAVEALRADPIYVDPEAEAQLDEGTAAQIRRRIEERGTGPMYIAVLPDDARNEAGGDASAVALRVGNGVRQPGTYLVVVGNTLRAAATRGILERGQAGELAAAAGRAHSDEGLGPILLDFVDRVGEARGGGGGLDRGSDGGESRGGEGGGLGGGLLLALLGGAAAIFGLRRFARRRQQRQEVDAQMEEVRETARDDLVALGDDIRALDLDVEMPDADPQGKRDYERALQCYQTASTRLDQARRPEDLEAVATALEEGRYAMAAAKAELAGLEPPERRPPCFFDPRHGPSVRDVEWAPPGGEPRPVPACAADALRVEEGDEPAAREVMVGGRPTPYWNAGPAYGPWAGGFFGGVGGGLLPGLFLGSMLGGGLGLGFPDHAQGYEGEGGDFGGGDSGGGDFGLDDFGGGDFGGGDFGGGDFGGGGE